jgi:hypothetical protein
MLYFNQKLQKILTVTWQLCIWSNHDQLTNSFGGKCLPFTEIFYSEIFFWRQIETCILYVSWDFPFTKVSLPRHIRHTVQISRLRTFACLVWQQSFLWPEVPRAWNRKCAQRPLCSTVRAKTMRKESSVKISSLVLRTLFEMFLFSFARTLEKEWEEWKEMMKNKKKG